MNLGRAGEVAALLVQKWFNSGPIVALMKIVILDIMKAQTTPELQLWFRETREAKFGKLEEVRQSISWKLQHSAARVSHSVLQAIKW